MVAPVHTKPDRRRAIKKYATGDFNDARLFLSGQAPPYNVATRYHRRTATTVSLNIYGSSIQPSSLAAPSETGGAGIQENFPAVDPLPATWAQNKALDSFRERVKSDSMWAVNMIERSQSVDMIIRAAARLTLFSTSLRRRNIRGISQSLGITVPPKLAKRVRKGFATPKSLADTWLEFHFGWDPLVKDIGAAVDALKRPLPSKVKGHGSSKNLLTSVSRGFNGSSVSSRATHCSARVQAEVFVTDANLFLANQLGLVNLLAIAWELVPYSFVVDWFTNVGTWLGSYTDYVGLNIRNPSSTQKGSCEYHYLMTYRPSQFAPWSSLDGVQSGTWIDRSTTLPSVKLGFKPPRPLGVIRGATAISLLLQKMPRL